MTFYVFTVFNVDNFSKEENFDFLRFFGQKIQMWNFNGKGEVDEFQD